MNIGVMNQFNESKRSLDLDEKKRLIKYFPNADISKVSSLGNAVIKLQTQNDPCDQYFQCVSNKKIIAIYHAINETYIQDIVEDLAKVLCPMQQFRCIEYYSIEAKYNCIGLAIGVMSWIEPSNINRHVKAGLSHIQAIDKFITEQSLIFSIDHPANVFQLLENFQNTTEQVIALTNNTVAFYFKDNECQHAARYIENFSA